MPLSFSPERLGPHVLLRLRHQFNVLLTPRTLAVQATITVVDPDENLDCSQVEYVAVFILLSPGSWNPDQVEDDGDLDEAGSPDQLLLADSHRRCCPGGVRGS